MLSSSLILFDLQSFDALRWATEVPGSLFTALSPLLRSSESEIHGSPIRGSLAESWEGDKSESSGTWDAELALGKEHNWATGRIVVLEPGVVL